MTPAERADKVRLVLERSQAKWGDVEDLLYRLLPSGSLIVTPDEAEWLRRVVESAMCGTEWRDEMLALLAGKGQA